MRRQEKAKQALERQNITLRRASASSMIRMKSEWFSFYRLTCPAVEASEGRICPWRCPWAGWWQIAGRNPRWRPGSASHLGPCRWASYLSPSIPQSWLQRSLTGWGWKSFLDDGEEMDEDLSESLSSDSCWGSRGLWWNSMKSLLNSLNSDHSSNLYFPYLTGHGASSLHVDLQSCWANRLIEGRVNKL